MATGAYAGANYVCADARTPLVVHGGDKVEMVELSPGLHVITNGNVDDPQDERHEFVRRMLDPAHARFGRDVPGGGQPGLLAQAGRHGRRGVVMTGSDFGTVSSTLLSLPRKIQHAIYQYAPGPPCDCAYDDLSALLRQVLSTERSRKLREADGHAAKAPEKTQ